MKTFFSILSTVLGIYFFISMLGTDDVGEKVENATLVIICYLDVIRYYLTKSDEKES